MQSPILRWGIRFGVEAAMALLILAASFGVVGALALAVTLGAIRAIS